MGNYRISYTAGCRCESCQGHQHAGLVSKTPPVVSGVGQGPPLVVFSGLSAEHANPTGLARRFELQTLRPMARHFTVYAVNCKPGLPAGSTIKDLAGHCAEALAHEFGGPVSVEGISTGGSIARQFAIDHPTWCAGWSWPRLPAGSRPTAERCSAGSPS